MDKDKDGILGKEDLRATWDQVGKLVSDKDLQEMLHEAPGPVNFTQLLSLFANRMAGGMILFNILPRLHVPMDFRIIQVKKKDSLLNNKLKKYTEKIFFLTKWKLNLLFSFELCPFFYFLPKQVPWLFWLTLIYLCFKFRILDMLV